MGNINEIITNFQKAKWIESIIVMIVIFIIYKSITHLFMKNSKSNRLNKKLSNKSKTYLKMITSILRYVFIIVTVLIVLQINGIDVSSMLAGVGIISVIIGFAVQDALKDIIKGFDIISDSYYQVGDVVKYGNIEGKVLSIGLKTTKIQDLATNNIISIANRNIEQVEVVSDVIYVNIPMPYGVTVETAEKAINDILERVKKNDNVDGCRYRGVNHLDESDIKYLIEVKCNPNFKLQVRRDTLRSALLGLADNNIEVPFNQIDVHLQEQ